MSTRQASLDRVHSGVVLSFFTGTSAAVAFSVDLTVPALHMVCGMLAMTVQCLLNCRVRSESEAQKHMRRRRKRKREKISKSQAAADSAEPDSQAADDEAGGKDEDDETLTAADELAPMQVCVPPSQQQTYAA